MKKQSPVKDHTGLKDAASKDERSYRSGMIQESSGTNSPGSVVMNKSDVPRGLLRRIRAGQKNIDWKFSEWKDYLTYLPTTANTESGNAVFHAVRQLEKVTQLENDALAAENSFKNLFKKLQRDDATNLGKCSEKLKKLLASREAEFDKMIAAKNLLVNQYKSLWRERREELKTEWDKREDDMVTICNRLRSLLEQLDDASRKEISLIRKLVSNEQNQVIIKSKNKVVQDAESGESERARIFLNLRSSALDKFKDMQYVKLKKMEDMQCRRLEIAEELHKFKTLLREIESGMCNNYGMLKYGSYLLNMQRKESKIVRSEVIRCKIQYFDKQVELKTELKKYNPHQIAVELNKLETRTKQDLQRHAHTYEFIKKGGRKKYDAIYAKKTEEIQAALKKLLEVDRTVHEEILEVKWEQPDLSFLVDEKSDVSTEDHRLDKLLTEFLKSPSATATASSPRDNNPVHHSSKFFVVEKPLDIEHLMCFVLESLDFLVSKDLQKFAKEKCLSRANFIISNSLLPTVGINSVDQLKNFIAFLIDKALSADQNNGSVKRTLLSKDIVDGLTEWREYRSNHAKLLRKEKSQKFRPERPIWKACRSAFPPAKEIIFDKLHDLLKKHYFTLEMRSRLMKKFLKECDMAHGLSSALGVPLPNVTQQTGPIEDMATVRTLPSPYTFVDRGSS